MHETHHTAGAHDIFINIAVSSWRSAHSYSTCYDWDISRSASTASHKLFILRFHRIPWRTSPRTTRSSQSSHRWSDTTKIQISRDCRLIQVDPDGDIVLKVGKADKAILAGANSTSLKHVLPVSKVVLGPCSFEGSKKHTIADPLELASDDPQGMLDLCDILHFNKMDEDDMPVSWFPALAIVADKYDCIDKIRPWKGCVLRRYVGQHSIDEPYRAQWMHASQTERQP